MRVLVIGGTGLIGLRFVQNRLSHSDQVWFTYKEHPHGVRGAQSFSLDITKRDEVLLAFAKAEPKIVFHCAALTNMDLCETDKALADGVNVEGTANVAEACQRALAKMVFISTSAVFSKFDAPVPEEANHEPVNHYGLTKSKAEIIVTSSARDNLILRLDHPYGWTLPWQKKNTVTRLLEALKKGERPKEVSDWWNQPTYAGDFVDAACELAVNGKKGIFHVVGQDFVTRYEAALRVAEVFDFSRDAVMPFSSKELKLAARRPRIHLSTEKLFKELGRRLPGLRDGLSRMKREENAK